MIMENYFPISIYPRWNFLLLAINQLTNHLDKLNYMTNNFYKSKCIVRTSVGSQRPLHPQFQHLGDYSKSISLMCKNINIVNLKKPDQIFREYKKAYERRDNISTILVEYGDYYNEK
jgi:pyruvate/2-oxoglutarate/acetoin dehydrogenase E1 component